MSRLILLLFTLLLTLNNISSVQAIFSKEECEIETMNYCKWVLKESQWKCNKNIETWCEFRPFKFREYANVNQCQQGEKQKCLNLFGKSGTSITSAGVLNGGQCWKMATNYCTPKTKVVNDDGAAASTVGEI